MIINIIIVLATIVCSIQVLEELVEYHARLMQQVKQDKKLDYEDGVTIWIIFLCAFLWCATLMFIL